MQTIKVIFPAVLGINQFDSQSVSLGPPFPAISIVLLDTITGLHEFGIEKQLPNTHHTMLNPVIDEAKRQIEYFWTVIAFVRDAVVRPTGETFYEFNNQRHEVNKIRKSIGATLNGVAGQGWFDANNAALTASYDLEKVKRLNFARSITEPIGRFIALYQILLTMNNDLQQKVDEAILKVDSTVAQTISPMNKHETTFTRLRNELAHYRKDSNAFSTYQEIDAHLDRFEWIVKTIVREDVLN